VVAQRRFGPLVAVVFAGLAVLLVRLAQIQIAEHEVWGAQAASLLRSSKVVPYHRGRILARDGRELVRDADVYEVEFCYREFRRGHPIAQIAHARSTLEQRAVPLTEAVQSLEAWSIELVLLSPADLDAFAAGAALATESCALPATDHPVEERRPQRASDLRFYVAEILHMTGAERTHARKSAEDPDARSSYIELVARARKLSPQALAESLRAELAAARAHLQVLAAELAQDPEIAAGTVGEAPFEVLIDTLEAQRERAEDAVADELFEQAAGFAPGRLSTSSLTRLVDVDWLASVLHWDATRHARWLATRRERYERELELLRAPRILSHVQSESEGELRADRLLAEIAEQFRPTYMDRRRSGDPAPAWQELDELCVLSEIDSLFTSSRGAAEFAPAAPVLALQDEEVRAASAELTDPWLAVGMIAELSEVHAVDAKAASIAPESAARWRRFSEAGRGFESPEAQIELVALLRALERRLVTACDRVLEGLSAAQSSDASMPVRLVLREERVARAMQQEKFVLRDKSNRPVMLSGSPRYPLVHLIERHPERYRGFEVRETTRRITTARDADGVPVAEVLIGRVRRPSLSDLFAQVRDEKRLQALQYKVLRTARDEAEIRELTARLYRADELTGASGIEAYFDPELRGRFGYRESDGGGGRGGRGLRADDVELFQPAEDGDDLQLTLDLDLQVAAQTTLAHPRMPSDSHTDRLWFENPVGAIVLITPQGEVLAAVSEPSRSNYPATPGRDEERRHVRDRSLQRPTFNPPGSVFKPFVAAYALDRMQFDPATRYTCLPIDDGGPGYADLHCHSLHTECDLARALQASCNSYFARLGEVFEPGALVDMATSFGFGQETGVRHLGTEGRIGLREDWRLMRPEKLTEKLGDAATRRRFTNGLGIIEATPMQVARATAGLLTGSLPEVHIVRAIGGKDVPLVAHDLGLSAASREFVQRAMESVVEDPGGTAYEKGLDKGSLGFRIAAKTGSGDYAAFKASPDQTIDDRLDMEAGKVRKHTWFAGWFPAEKPAAILVVYLHDVSETASHTAVYVAAQFLSDPAVRRFVDDASAPPKRESGDDAKRGTTGGAIGASAPRADVDDGNTSPERDASQKAVAPSKRDSPLKRDSPRGPR
jgi:cell division protein FtsI/penicillin-binding protein 2